MPRVTLKVYKGPGYPVDPKRQLEREWIKAPSFNSMWEFVAEDYQLIGFDLVARALAIPGHMMRRDQPPPMPSVVAIDSFTREC